MGNLSSFQHQKLRPANTVQSSFAPQVRPSIPSPFPVTTPPNEQTSLEHARQFQEGIERMSIFPGERNATPLAYGGQKTSDAIQRKRSFTKQMMQRQEIDEIQEQHVSPKKNMTGLPDALKAGVESLSGVSLDDVKVHYDSSKPAEMQAWAYAQGTNIYVEKGQKKYLPHEAWHVAQQKQGRVKPTSQAKGVAFNDDQSLEKEADTMGTRAMQIGSSSLQEKADNYTSSTSSSSSVTSFPSQKTSTNPIALKPQSGIAPIQRGIRKPGKKGETYTRAPTSYGAESFSKAVKASLQEIIDNDEKHPKTGKDFTLRQAIAEAKQRVRATGRFVTGRKGTRIKDSAAMLTHISSLGADTTTTQDKFNRGMAPIYDAALNSVEVMEEDFQTMPISSTPATAHGHFVSTFNQVVPSLTRTASAFNEVAEEMVNQGGSLASSLKGSMFEHLARSTVLTHANRRVLFRKQGKMQSDRSSDAYDRSTKTLWDMKHYFDTDVPKDQAEDYSEIVTKGYTSTSGDQVSAVNYLFPSIDGAKKNEWLNTTYGFGIYYADKDQMKQHK